MGLMKREAAAVALGISLKTLDRRIAAGQIEAKRLGPRDVRVEESALRSYIQAAPSARRSQA